jgi:hypothetical protein
MEDDDDVGARVDVAPTPDGGVGGTTTAEALPLTAASAVLVTRPMATGARGNLLPGTLPLTDAVVVGAAVLAVAGAVCGGEGAGWTVVPDVAGGVGVNGPLLLCEGGVGTKGRGGLLCPPAPAPPARESARMLDGTAEKDGRGLSLPRADATNAAAGMAASGLLITAMGARGAKEAEGADGAGGGTAAPAAMVVRRRKGAAPSTATSSAPRRRKSSSSNNQSSSSSRAASARSSGDEDSPGPMPLLSSST